MSDAFHLEVLPAWEVTRLPEPITSDLLLGPYAVRGARTIVVGDTGHGKTTLALQMVAAAVRGRDFLGHRGAGNIRALVVDLEQGLRSVKRCLREAGLEDSERVGYVRVPDGLALDQNTHHLAELERELAEGDYGILLLDPYYKAHDGDSNDELAIKRLMAKLDALRARHGFALILPAHPRKDIPGRTGARKLSLHDVAGSGAVTRGAELIIAIERLSHGYARLRILKDRDGDLPINEAWPLLFSRGDGFRLDPKEDDTEEELEQRVLGSGDTWRTKKEWAAVFGIRETRAGQLLERLAETDRVEFRVGPPGRSPKARCYRTAPDERAKSGAVTQSPPGETTAPLLPTAIGAVGEGSSHTSAPASPALFDDTDPERPTARQDDIADGEQ